MRFIYKKQIIFYSALISSLTTNKDIFQNWPPSHKLHENAAVTEENNVSTKMTPKIISSVQLFFKTSLPNPHPLHQRCYFFSVFKEHEKNNYKQGQFRNFKESKHSHVRHFQRALPGQQLQLLTKNIYTRCDPSSVYHFLFVGVLVPPASIVFDLSLFSASNSHLR